jgi:hypothetical protein
MSTELAQRGARGVGEVDPRVKNDEEDERDDGRGEAGLREVGGLAKVERSVAAASGRVNEARPAAGEEEGAWRARRGVRAQRADEDARARSAARPPVVGLRPRVPSGPGTKWTARG